MWMKTAISGLGARVLYLKQEVIDAYAVTKKVKNTLDGDKRPLVRSLELSDVLCLHRSSHPLLTIHNSLVR